MRRWALLPLALCIAPLGRAVQAQRPVTTATGAPQTVESVRARLLARIAQVPGADVAIAVRDLGSDRTLDLNGDTVFHAASTMKVPVLFALVYWLGRALAGRGPGLFAVGLLATLPLIGQNATGAGMEMHNLVMLALAMVLAVLWLQLG
jgi:hypothetical protein